MVLEVCGRREYFSAHAMYNVPLTSLLLNCLLTQKIANNRAAIHYNILLLNSFLDIQEISDMHVRTYSYPQGDKIV